MYNILVVEDDIDICEIIKIYMLNANYMVTTAHTAKDALNIISKNTFDLILLDIMLPDIMGLDLCNELRNELLCPIIFMSCIDDDKTIVKALEMGGDDYIVKPFSYNVLLARIEANMRRVSYERTNYISDRYLVDPEFIIDYSNYTVIKNGREINLTPIEFKILSYMVDNPKRIITLNELYENIWNEQSFDDVRTVKVHVSNLRKKIEVDPSNPKYIITVRRIGYMFQ